MMDATLIMLGSFFVFLKVGQVPLIFLKVTLGFPLAAETQGTF